MAKSILSEPDIVIEPDRPDFPLVIQAMQDLSNLCFIWDVLRPCPDDTELWSKVKYMFGGSDLPESGERNPIARNTQFELFALSMFRRSGFELDLIPRGQAGAEAICKIGEHRIAVEAKRVSSLSQLLTRIRQGRDQIAALDIPGVVAIEFAQAVHSGRRWRPVLMNEELLRSTQRPRFERFWNDYGTRIQQVCEGSSVLGLIFCDYIFAQLAADRTRGTSDWQYCTFTDLKKLPVRWVTQRRLQGVVFDLLSSSALPHSEP